MEKLSFRVVAVSAIKVSKLQKPNFGAPLRDEHTLVERIIGRDSMWYSGRNDGSPSMIESSCLSEAIKQFRQIYLVVSLIRAWTYGNDGASSSVKNLQIWK